MSGRTIADLERGVNRTPRQDTLRLLATALRLAPPTRDIFEGAASAARPPRPLTTSPGGAATVGIHRPPVVGRQRDLALVEQHVAGSGLPVVLFSGEPGIGKTRLLQEACRRAARDGWMVVQGGCHRRGGQEPYAPLQDALERHVRERSPSQLRDDLRGCAWLVRLLPQLARGPIEPVHAWTLPPEQERRLMWLAVARFLATIAGPAGTLLVLDDLQWAGADALDLLAALARGATDTHLRIVGAYRDTGVTPLAPLATVLADLAHTGLVTHRRLAPLAPANALQVIAGVLPGDQDAGQIREQIVQRAGGAPFFLVSFAEAQRPTAGANPGEAVPWHIGHSIRQRMHALPAWAREVVEIAAVAGREGSPTLLAATAAPPRRGGERTPGGVSCTLARRRRDDSVPLCPLAQGQIRPPEGVAWCDWERVRAARAEDATRSVAALRRLGPEVAPGQMLLVLDEVLTPAPGHGQINELRTACLLTADGCRYLSGRGIPFLRQVQAAVQTCYDQSLLVVTDGAGWIRTFCRDYLARLPQTELLLDWHHLAKKCRDLARQICPERARGALFLRRLFRWLWVGAGHGAQRLLARSRPQAADAVAVDTLSAYLEARAEWIPNYRARRRQRRSIGNGLGEKANDRIVVRRQKRRGMQWGAETSDSLAALRTLVLNEGWDDYWQRHQLLHLDAA